LSEHDIDPQSSLEGPKPPEIPALWNPKRGYVALGEGGIEFYEEHNLNKNRPARAEGDVETTLVHVSELTAALARAERAEVLARIGRTEDAETWVE
jgi:hypothetical protein